MRLPTAKRRRPANAPLEPAKSKPRASWRGGRLRLGLGALLTVLTFTVATTAVGIYTVHRQYEVVKMGYAIDQRLFEYRRALEANKRLRLSLGSYKHPTSVAAFADETLDMRQPTNTDELIVPVGGKEKQP